MASIWTMRNLMPWALILLLGCGGAAANAPENDPGAHVETPGPDETPPPQGESTPSPGASPAPACGVVDGVLPACGPKVFGLRCANAEITPERVGAPYPMCGGACPEGERCAGVKGVYDSATETYLRYCGCVPDRPLCGEAADGLCLNPGLVCHGQGVCGEPCIYPGNPFCTP